MYVLLENTVDILFLSLCRPLPPDEMKNIIFSVFGEDMSTGVVTQVNSVCSHKYAIVYLSFFFFFGE